MTPARQKTFVVVGFVLAMCLVGAVWPAYAPLIAIALGTVWLAIVIGGRSFFLGRAAMARKRYADAIAHFERFEAGPARSLLRLLWISTYTSDPVALAQNDIGVCQLRLRRPERAVLALEAARARDDAYAIPHANLAVAHRMLGDLARSQAHSDQALQLGYRRDLLQRAIDAATAAHNGGVGAMIAGSPPDGEAG